MKKRVFPSAVLLLILQLPVAGAENNEVFFSIIRGAIKDFVAPQDVITLDKSEIDAYKAKTAGDLLEYLPSVSVRKQNGDQGLATVSMRGFPARQTVVVIDDIKIPADLTGTVDLSALPVANIDKVEIMPGAGSSVYGANAEGGVVHLMSKPLNSGARLAEFETETGSYGSRINSVKTGFSGGPLELLLTGRSDHSDGFQENSALNKNSITGVFSYNFGGTGKLTLRGFDAGSRIGLPEGTPVPIDQWDGKKERKPNSTSDSQTTERNMVSAAYELPLNGAVRVNVNSGIGNNILDAYQWGSYTLIKLRNRTASLKCSIFDTAVIGAEYERNILNSPVYGDHSNKTYGVFVQEIFKPSRDLEFVPGLRYDANELYSDQLSPKLAVVYSPGMAWKFSAQAGKAWQAPTFADLYDPFVPPADRSADLKPERSVQYQAGGRWNSASGFYASLAGFYAVIKDRIALDPAKSFAAYNLESAFNEGVESEAGYRNGGFSASANYNYILSKGRGAGSAYQLLQFSPKHRLNAVADLRSGYGSVLLKGRYVSRQFTGRDGGGMKLPQYFTGDLYLSKEINNLEFSVGADNIFDRHYAETADAFNGYYPQPGRVFRIAMKLSI